MLIFIMTLIYHSQSESDKPDIGNFFVEGFSNFQRAPPSLAGNYSIYHLLLSCYQFMSSMYHVIDLLWSLCYHFIHLL